MIRLISLNIEGDNHYDTIFPFFSKENPDVICMQEFFVVDTPLFEEKLGMSISFLPLQKITKENPHRQSLKGTQGIAIASKFPILNGGFHFYESVPTHDTFDATAGVGRRGLLWVDVTKDGKTFRIATTHFTWSQKGSVTDLQRGDLRNLLEALQEVKPDMLCGDFNAPRGTEIFDTLATHFTDNVPKDITTSIDQNLHRVQGIQLMVDGFFTNESVNASDVRVIDGVSDHCAIVGIVE